MNIVDCAAILPYYITLFFMPADDFGPLPSTTPSAASTESQLARLVVNATVGPAEEEEDGVFGSFSRIFQVFRIARIMRIFKLARRSIGLQVHMRSADHLSVEMCEFIQSVNYFKFTT